MKIIVVDNGSKHIRALSHLCQNYGEVRTVTPQDIDSIQGELIVLSGSHMHLAKNSNEYYAAERRLVLEYPGPIIGVCAGMQLIASAYGCVLRHRDTKIEGTSNIRLLDSTLRFAMGGAPTVAVAERHGWEVPYVEYPLLAMAESDGGVEVLRHQTRPLMGMQFHPEMHSAGGKAIFEWAVEQITAQSAGRD